MSYYQKGLDISGFNITRGVATPSVIKSFKEEVDRQITSLGQDIVALWKRDCTDAQGNMLDQCPWTTLKDAYGNFVSEWKNFYLNSSNLWGSTYDRTESYQDQLRTWRAKFVEQTGQKPTGPEPLKQDHGVSIGSLLGWGLAIAGVAIAGPPIIRAIRNKD